MAPSSTPSSLARARARVELAHSAALLSEAYVASSLTGTPGRPAVERSCCPSPQPAQRLGREVPVEEIRRRPDLPIALRRHRQARAADTFKEAAPGVLVSTTRDPGGRPWPSDQVLMTSAPGLCEHERDRARYEIANRDAVQ